MQTPSRFSPAILSMIERSKICFSSSSLIRGATSFCANSRTVCTSASWSSVSSNSIIGSTDYTDFTDLENKTAVFKTASSEIKQETCFTPCGFQVIDYLRLFGSAQAGQGF